MATQRVNVAAELLPAGTGEPDQAMTLSRPPVIPRSVRLQVTPPSGSQPEVWREIDDLATADPR